MRRVLEEQRYLEFTGDASPKVVKAFREKYGKISRKLDESPLILWLVNEDLRSLSTSDGGRGAVYTSEMLFRALLVHQIEKTSLRETVIRVAESETLRSFVRLGHRPMMDYSFLDRAFKAITPETWGLVNQELARRAARKGEIDIATLRADSTVVEGNIHYPTDTSLLWDSYRVLSRVLRVVRDAVPEYCPHRFHDRKAKKDMVYVNRYMRSKSQPRRREMKLRFRRLLESVRRLSEIARPLPRKLAGSLDPDLAWASAQLKRYLPLVRTVCDTAERAGLKGETVPASDRVFSIFEDHVELIQRGKSRHPTEFGHAVWLAQTREKFITDYETMERKVPDTELLDEIVGRHKVAFGSHPNVIAADTGFRAAPDEMAKIEEIVETVAVPGRGLSRAKIARHWHRFRAGIEGSISVLKRAFRLSVCMYRSFKSFAAAVGMAVFCHNLITLTYKRAPA